MTQLPVRYHLEIYFGSFGGDVMLAAKGETPFMTLAVGDWIAVGDMVPPVKLSGRAAFQVSAVQHAIWTIEDSHHGHKVMVTVDVAQLPL